MTSSSQAGPDVEYDAQHGQPAAADPRRCPRAARRRRSPSSTVAEPEPRRRRSKVLNALIASQPVAGRRSSAQIRTDFLRAAGDRLRSAACREQREALRRARLNRAGPRRRAGRRGVPEHPRQAAVLEAVPQRHPGGAVRRLHRRRLELQGQGAQGGVRRQGHERPLHHPRRLRLPAAADARPRLATRSRPASAPPRSKPRPARSTSSTSAPPASCAPRRPTGSCARRRNRSPSSSGR